MAGAGKNYTLGKGKLFLNIFEEGLNTGKGEIYFSQTPELSFTVATEKLDHYDSDEGINVLDEQVTTKVDVNGKFKTDNISPDSMGLFLLSGTSTNVVTAAGMGVVDTITAYKGRFYQLGTTANNPVGVRSASNAVVRKGVTVIAPANYTFDGPLARIYIKPDAADITDADSITVTYDVAASTREQTISRDKQVRGSMRFQSANPVGAQRDFFFPLVNITPDGDYSLKGDQWLEVGFAFAALKLGTLERVYADGRPL